MARLGTKQHTVGRPKAPPGWGDSDIVGELYVGRVEGASSHKTGEITYLDHEQHGMLL